MAKNIANIVKVKLGNDATSIAANAFAGCTKLEDVQISKTVTSIGNGAFSGLANLTVIKFNDRTKTEIKSLVGDFDAKGIDKEIVVDKDNALLYDKSQKMTVVLEDGTESSEYLETTTLTRSKVTSYTYSQIESISLGSSVTAAEDGCFLDCDKLTELILDGIDVETAASKVADWELGINQEGDVHLVVIYCADGVVVINDADSSSGELGLRIDWDKFSTMLEDYPNMTALPAVGTSLIVPYKVDVSGDPVDTEWEVLGYNTSIPEYVKYKNGDTRIYVSSVKDGLLGSISSGDAVYLRDEAGNYGKTDVTVSSVGSGTFTFGNNKTWSAPMSIVVNRETYSFAGYNCTLLCKYALGCKYNGNLYCYPQFNSADANDWSSSQLRAWLNSDAASSMSWQTITWSESTTGSNIAGFTGRLTDAKFMKHVMPAVNRTWVYSDWRAGKTLENNEVEHVVDKFWLLGIGNVNCSGSYTNSYFKDQNYDTNKYSDTFIETDIWNSESSHIRRAMKEDGSKGSPCTWWLRSARSNLSTSVGYVDYYGGVDYDLANDNVGVLPACTIC